MNRSKPTGRVCMFLVGTTLIVLILLSYRWFMVPNTSQRDRKEVLYYRNRPQNLRNQMRVGEQRNFYDDRSLTDKSKTKFNDVKQSGDGGQQSQGFQNRFQNQQNQRNQIEKVMEPNKPNEPVSKEKGSEEETKGGVEKLEPSPKVLTEQMSAGRKEMPTIKSLYRDPDPLYSDRFKQLKRIVHLDLKGAAPNMEYLKQLFPLFKKLGATGVLMEYEDMFPYSGNLEPLAAGNCYTKENIKMIMTMAQDNDLDIIPLVQTFGHLEFALKLSEFKSLREDERIPQVIHIGDNKTYDFLYSMIDQVMEIHSGKMHIHLGADEVYTLGKGKSMKMLKDNVTVEHLFFKHVKRIAQYVKDKYKIKPIIWDDMFRHLEVQKLKDANVSDLVEPMVWCYLRDPRQKLPHDIWVKYRQAFKSVWIASSFKGATGVAKFATDVTYHIENHLSWVDIIKKEILSEAQNGLTLHGVALTGWQRYDHFSVLCELLPAAIPSLAANLQILSTGGFTESNHKMVTEVLGCKANIQLELCTNQTADDCEFPGSKVYYSIRKLWRLKQSYIKYMDRYRGWVSDHNFKQGFASPYRVRSLRKNLIAFASNVTEIEKFMWNGLEQLYDNYTAGEWIEENIRSLLDKLPEKLGNLRLLMGKDVWPKRPLKMNISPSDDVTFGQGQGQNQQKFGWNQQPNKNQNPWQKQNQGKGLGSFRQSHFPPQNQLPQGQNQIFEQSRIQKQNQIQGINNLLGQNQASKQYQDQWQRQIPGQNQVPGQNRLLGQNQVPGQNRLLRQNQAPYQFPGKNQPQDKNPLFGKLQQLNSNDMRQNKKTEENQFPPRNQLQNLNQGNRFPNPDAPQSAQGTEQKGFQKDQNNPGVSRDNAPQKQSGNFPFGKQDIPDNMKKLQDLVGQGKDANKVEGEKRKESSDLKKTEEEKPETGKDKIGDLLQGQNMEKKMKEKINMENTDKDKKDDKEGEQKLGEKKNFNFGEKKEVKIGEQKEENKIRQKERGQML